VVDGWFPLGTGENVDCLNIFGPISYKYFIISPELDQIFCFPGANLISAFEFLDIVWLARIWLSISGWWFELLEFTFKYSPSFDVVVSESVIDFLIIYKINSVLLFMTLKTFDFVPRRRRVSFCINWFLWSFI